MLNNSSFRLIKRFAVSLVCLPSALADSMVRCKLRTNICTFSRRGVSAMVGQMELHMNAVGCCRPFLSFAHAMRRALANNNNEWPTQHFFTENINQKSEFRRGVENHPQQPIGYCYTNNKLSAATKEPTTWNGTPCAVCLFDFLADLLRARWYYWFLIYLFESREKKLARRSEWMLPRHRRHNGSSSSTYDKFINT